MHTAGLGSHGGAHPVRGHPSAKTVGATWLVDARDVLVCDDPEETEGSELLVIEGTLARLALVLVDERRARVPRSMRAWASATRVERGSSTWSPSESSIAGLTLVASISSHERHPTKAGISRWGRVPWAMSWVMVAVGDDGIDTHGGVRCGRCGALAHR